VAVCRIVVDRNGIDAAVFAPFEFKEIIKSISGRRWDKVRKCWVVDVAHVDTLAAALQLAGLSVFITHANGDRWTKTKSSQGQRAKAVSSWVDQAFTAVAPDKTEKLRRGLLTAFHPDHGGSHDISVQINQAADKAIRGGRRG
jgi:hypothetical protein